jgi:cob(I)alamin adenosyltransferase
VRIYTKTGDDGTTGLLYGGRVRKDDAAPMAYGSVDEAQAVLGLARADCEPGSELDVLLVGLERDLWVLMAELATEPSNRIKLRPGESLVTGDMVDGLEPLIDDLTSRFEPPREFVVPGQNRVAALLDLGRTVVRRAERHALSAAADGSHVVPYLNRLSDLLWTMARWQEGDHLPARDRARQDHAKQDRGKQERNR